MTTEIITHSAEFEQKTNREIERKFLPIFPEMMDEYRTEAWPLEQYYLSHPSEDFSLRMREEFKDGELNYTATLKDTGKLTVNGVDRMEVEVPVAAEIYNLYKTQDVPALRKLRAEPLPGITIDYYEDGSVQVESESPVNWSEFTAKHGDVFMDITGDRMGNNEWRAHLSFRRANAGEETLRPATDLQPRDIVNDILVTSRPGVTTVAHIAGRSGSGKSTIVREVREQLSALGVESVVLSTDDYHRGNTWLVNYNGGEPWTKWDDAVVYDTVVMANDLAELQAGRPIWRRWIDFTDCEPKYDGIIQPAPVVIVEGIYAASPDVVGQGDLMYEMTTPLATCVGRRLLRDLKERPEFADPQKSLAYILNEAEVAYRNQDISTAKA